ncbi:hypothetical protein [Aeromonas sp. MR16]|uniref:hypothetical protein n=1 Tax=Aeromonas sp. MR16 TaxID=2923420 RepID=UPI001F4A3CB2|nr:hypothetical protein [Aeromonas sp. MR16]MCH7370030.1 hypothetical protein [Aeromonas sp. MR16]
MLLESATPILGIAIDDVPNFYNQHLGALSLQLGEVTGAENGWLDNALDKFLDSDVSKKKRRLFIPIDDALYPIHYTGGTTDNRNESITQKTTNKDGGSVITTTTTPANNTITLNFEIKSSVSNISTIADILHALANSAPLKAGDVPRICFFSATMCIFDAKFIGINRSTVTNSQKEMVTLTLETVTDAVVVLEKETPKTDSKTLDSSGKSSAKSSDPLEQAQATLADFDPAYDFYLVATRDYLDAIPVPHFEAEQTIKRQPYQIFRVESKDRTGAKRNMQGVAYGGQNISLESREPFKYRPPLGLVRYGDSLYLGIKRES